jgi:hypothetical protein
MSMPRRIRTLSASSGAGQVRAAQALEKAFAARGDARVESIDALDDTSKLFQKIYGDAYIALLRRAPSLMDLLYDRFDQPWRHRRRRLVLDPGLRPAHGAHRADPRVAGAQLGSSAGAGRSHPFEQPARGGVEDCSTPRRCRNRRGRSGCSKCPERLLPRRSMLGCEGARANAEETCE